MTTREIQTEQKSCVKYTGWDVLVRDGILTMANGQEFAVENRGEPPKAIIGWEELGEFRVCKFASANRKFGVGRVNAETSGNISICHYSHYHFVPEVWTK